MGLGFASLALWACTNAPSLTATIIDENVVAYDLNPSREEIYYLKAEGETLGLWAYALTPAAPRAIAPLPIPYDQTARPNMQTLAFTAEGRLLVQDHETGDVWVFADDTLVNTYAYFSWRKLFPDLKYGDDLSPAQKQQLGAYYRQRLEQNVPVPYITAAGYGADSTYYLVRDENDSPILLPELPDAVLGAAFHETEPVQFRHWQWDANQGLAETSTVQGKDYTLTLTDSAHGLTLVREERGDCPPGGIGFLFTDPCRIGYSIAFAGSRLRISEAKADPVAQPHSHHFVTADGRLVLVVKGDLQVLK